MPASAVGYHREKRLLVIHDRAQQHKGLPVETIVREADGQLVLMAQPAYSPELNPEARIWKGMRRVVTRNDWFESFTAQINGIRDFFRYLAGCKDQVCQLCGIKTSNL